MAIRIPTPTKEYIRTRVSAREMGALVNPTTEAAHLAFKISGQPAGGDWKVATWETDTSSSPTTYFMRAVVGGIGSGAAVELAVGTYTIWAKVTTATETATRVVGQLEIF
jgi:hypothetical protein